MPGPVGSASALGPAAMPLLPFTTGAGCHFKMDGPAPAHQAEGQSSPLGVPITVASEGGGRGETHVVVMGRGWTGLRGTPAAGGSGANQTLFVQGCSRHLVWMWPRVHTGRPGQLGGHLSGHLPHFHVKGRDDITWGLGAAICSWEGIVLRATCPRTRVAGLAGAECQGEEGNQQKVLSGGWALKGRAVLGCCHHLCPCPQSRSDGPPPCQDHAAAGQRAPSPPLLAAT